ncbi:MAG: hypothetical protein CMG60_08195 [Candidatus Marinimicrobia bacterium]|nr:hypothetical protein [Candidatus Neomarinimicrobiota bacterium]|tara:strand:+ start:1341 stop:1649 length:309 start_codon:yes stop_codon:yes gene_type:complete
MKGWSPPEWVINHMEESDMQAYDSANAFSQLLGIYEKNLQVLGEAAYDTYLKIHELFVGSFTKLFTIYGRIIKEHGTDDEINALEKEYTRMKNEFKDPIPMK